MEVHMDYRARDKLRRRDVIALFAGAAASWPLAKTAMAQYTLFRGGDTESKVQASLGNLGELTGTWMGNGFSLVSLPDPTKDPPFRLKLNATKEILTLTSVGAKIPDAPGMNFLGLHYFQQISDASTSAALHLEPGIWLVPEPKDPKQKGPKEEVSVVRLSTIPHGTSLLAQGLITPPTCQAELPDPRYALCKDPPKIGPANAIPFTLDPDPKLRYRWDVTDPKYIEPFLSAALPPGIPAGASVNPNIILVRAMENLTIRKTVTVKVSATPVADIDQARLAGGTAGGDGLLNIPFLLANANATSFASTFWIERVKDETEKGEDAEYAQLQYSQTAILDFGGLKWPHITVGTLIKQ
jgi:hypothetical protein